MKEQNNNPSHSLVEDEEASAQQARKRKAVYTIIEREGNNRSYWLRLGTAYINRDDSLTVYLNALPVNNKLHIREFPENNESAP
jgi:hypothetical protein